MAAVIHKDSLNPDGSWKAPVGTGPFRFGEWKRGQEVVLTRFDGYVSPPGEKRDGFTGQKKALVQEARFLVVPDSSTVKAGLESGRVDIAEIVDSDIPELEKSKTVKVLLGSTGGRHAVIFQTTDPRVQERQDAPGHRGRDRRQPARGFRGERPREAERLHDPFALALLQRGAGPRRRPTIPNARRSSSRRPATRAKRSRSPRTTARPRPSFNIAVVIQAMLQQVGVPADIDVVEWATHMDRFLKGNYQLMVHSYSSRFDPALGFEHFTGPKSSQPRKVWDNPEVQQLLEKAAATSDEGARQTMFDELHTRMLDEMPLIILFNQLDAWATSARVEGFTPNEGRARVWGVSVTRTDIDALLGLPRAGRQPDDVPVRSGDAGALWRSRRKSCILRPAEPSGAAHEPARCPAAPPA
jgi:peptide/nickel transport system substrate-binding protein